MIHAAATMTPNATAARTDAPDIFQRIPATLALEDGTVFRGRSFGAEGETAAEIIFHTGMTGYQEVVTDPSYRGQAVVMTYPLIGNYGVNALDGESARPQAAAFIVKELAREASSWRGEEGLHGYLARHGTMGIEGIDTRALVLHLRRNGAMRGVISTTRPDDHEGLVKAAGESPGMTGQSLVHEVSATAAYAHAAPAGLAELNTLLGGLDGRAAQANAAAAAAVASGGGGDARKPHVVAYDFGVKRNILDLLAAEGFRVTVVPSRATAAEVMALEPDGVFLSNGPGDPAALPEIVGEVKALMGQVPMFGICLGHQILGLASGAMTYKLPFGHHGANHPVMDHLTQRVEITSQNHGFAVDAATLPAGASITHTNLNDGTVEGFEDAARKFFCVQYHPEAAPGPHDSNYLFRRFREWVDRG